MPYVKVANRKKATYSAEIMAQYTNDTKAPFHCNKCEFVAKSEPSLVMHHRRKHGNMVVPNEAPKTGEFTLSTEVEKPKRKWTRRTPEANVVPTAKSVNFCPCCGLNIANINYTMGLMQ